MWKTTFLEMAAFSKAMLKKNDHLLGLSASGQGQTSTTFHSLSLKQKRQTSGWSQSLAKLGIITLKATMPLVNNTAGLLLFPQTRGDIWRYFLQLNICTKEKTLDWICRALAIERNVLQIRYRTFLACPKLPDHVQASKEACINKGLKRKQQEAVPTSLSPAQKQTGNLKVRECSCGLQLG